MTYEIKWCPFLVIFFKRSFSVSDFNPYFSKLQFFSGMPVKFPSDLDVDKF